MTTTRKFALADYADECPDHGGEIRREYDFGPDATIYTHVGCKCCVLTTRDLGGYENDSAAIGSYGDLVGVARLQSAMNMSR